MKNDQIQAIYDDYINGNRRDMADKIDAYGLYDVFSDLHEYLAIRGYYHNASFADICILYHHIKYR